MQWSQLKKRIENNFSASVKKRIVLHTTRYSKFCDCCGRLWIEIDGEIIIDTNTFNYHDKERRLERETGKSREVIQEELNREDYFAQYQFASDMFDYLNYSIDEAIVSKRPVIRALGMLDQRLGKRRLHKMDVSQETGLVKRFYYLRCVAEGLPLPVGPDVSIDLHSRVDAKWLRKPKAIDTAARDRADAALVVKKVNKLNTFVKKILKSEITKDNLISDRQKEIFAFIETVKDTDFVLNVLHDLDKKSKLCKDTVYLKGVLNLIKDQESWIQNVMDWSPESHNVSRQFSSLVRFLLCRYDVPRFMDQAYLGGNITHQDWLKHIGSGKNVCSVKTLPIVLTKKMAHHFLKAPHNYSIEGALRWGQVHALGGDQRLCDALMETRLAGNFAQDEFWLSVIRFFIRNPMLDTACVNPIVDYIWNRKFENRRVFVERGVAREEGPEQPNFSMRGRTTVTLLAEVENWHRQLGREVKGSKLQWAKSRIGDFEYIEGTQQSRNMKVWKIKELLSSHELIAEGRQLRHCVASYARSCHQGRSTIWTLEHETEDGVEKLLTIEVSVPSGTIKQIRGKSNRLANEKEKSVIRRWAEKEGLVFASYLAD